MIMIELSNGAAIFTMSRASFGQPVRRRYPERQITEHSAWQGGDPPPRQMIRGVVALTLAAATFAFCGSLSPASSTRWHFLSAGRSTVVDLKDGLAVLALIWILFPAVVTRPGRQDDIRSAVEAAGLFRGRYPRLMACAARTCAASSDASRAGSPRAMPHSVAMPPTLVWCRAAASRATSPSGSSWWMRPR
jgi:hypothetical protein